MADLYQVLGVAKNATDDEIRKAYRKLAKANHPDLNPGNAAAEKRFKEISAAYSILGEPEKRRAYDAGEIDESGAARPERRFYRDYAGAESGFRYGQPEDFGNFEDLGGVFSDLFSRARRGPAGTGAETQFRMRGNDIHYSLAIDFMEAINGAKKRVDMPDGRTLDITIPAGVTDGQTLRLKGQGSPGYGGGASGDALITISVNPHPTFRREGNDIRSVLPITLSEALLGGTVQVDTATGPVSLKIPKHSNTGRVLRLRGKGVQGRVKGDQLVELQVIMPPDPDAELEQAIEGWERQHPYNPRQRGEAGR